MKTPLDPEEAVPSAPFWLHTAISDAPCTVHAIPLLDLDQLDLREAQAAPLIVALADIIEATCARSPAVPMTHAVAA